MMNLLLKGSFEEDRTDDPDGKKKGNDGSSRGTRPVWFLGSDDHSIQVSCLHGET